MFSLRGITRQCTISSSVRSLANTQSPPSRCFSSFNHLLSENAKDITKISQFEQVDNKVYEDPKSNQSKTAFEAKPQMVDTPQNIYIQSRPKRIVVAITGATGVAMGIRVLQILKELNIETHLIISKWGAATMKYETDWTPQEVAALATKVYTSRDVSAPISSGSFQHDGMIVVPCSMKTLAAIRIGFTEDLITRAADVSMKERRKVLLVTRETPLSNVHLENMLSLSRDGVIIFPPVPAFYTRPKSVDDIIEQSVGRILDCFGINTNNFPRWNGMATGHSAIKKNT